ncbi:M28 family peptidase [Phytohabitans aurantiacus]|uniref:Peptidase M28 domain-containing protein n=1 Tax=Phytohabitans aurantiacus TaxID=3016789 RepID=A0ABQ5R015_9ACTN|nr:M28 family peptidase [Phytohabitans aurantiacus]GLH99890.1 hypothetical protein Pa4123_51660 [Phytohabitans aurantiacus]
MSMRDLTDFYQQAIRPQVLLDHVAAVAFDRLQGSTGLARAATVVEGLAADAGLDVTVAWHPPGAPTSRWWQFTAPAANSPVAASLHLGDHLIAQYATCPMILARGSASTPTGGMHTPLVTLAADAPSQADLTRAFVLVPPTPRFKIPALLDRLTAAGAAAVGVESASPDPGRVDRLEIPDRCPLVAMSLSGEQAARLRATGPGTELTVHAEHEPAAAMPVVHAVVPGAAPGPAALLIAHLCHPGPGADDNASGVAALLSIGAAAAALPAQRRPRLELLWAPEMVGTAAWLHERLKSAKPLPDFVISVDMVGAHPTQTGAVLTIERSADHVPSPLAAALDAAADAADPPVISYSTASTCSRHPRMVVPFVGASDHLLFSDPKIAIPGAHLTCGPSSLHHSSRDTVSTLSAKHLHRHTAMVAAATTALCTGAATTDILAAMRRLDLTRLAEVTNRDPMDAQAARDAISSAYDTLARWTPPAAPDIELSAAAIVEIAGRLLGATIHTTPAGTPAIEPLWDGPWNLHNLLAAVDPTRRAAFGELLGAGGDRYAAAVALAHAIDGTRTPEQLRTAAAAAAGIPISIQFTEVFLSTMTAAGWVRTKVLSQHPAIGQDPPAMR